MDQAKRGVSSPVPTLPATSVASGSSNTAPPIISAPPVQTVEAPSKPVTSTVWKFCFFVVLFFKKKQTASLREQDVPSITC